MSEYRLIIEDGVTPQYGLAADETIALRVGAGNSLPTLRLYTYQSHVAFVGRFQNIDHELHLNYCSANDIQVNRRPTGGGAIIMGQDQLGIAFCIDGGNRSVYGNAKQLMQNFSQGIILGLAKFGIDASFTRKNDLEVGGKKIAGLGLHRTSTGGLLFHCSLLVGLDVPLMLRVLNTPFEKLTDKQIDTIGRRITTVKEQIGRMPQMADVRAAISAGFEKYFKQIFVIGDVSIDEKTAIETLSTQKYDDQEWVFRRNRVADLEGIARIKTPEGMVVARIALAGQQIKSLYLEGDFFSSHSALSAVESSFRWHSLRSEQIAATIALLHESYGDDLKALPADVLQTVIQNAVNNAMTIPNESNDPYGCFVTPDRAMVEVENGRV